MCATATRRTHRLSYMMPFQPHGMRGVTVSRSDNSIRRGYLDLNNRRCNSALNLTIQACRPFGLPQWPQKQGPPAFKQAILHPASCQPTTNSLQSACSAPRSLSMATRLQCHISPSTAMKDWPPLTAPHNTQPCAAPLLALLRWAAPRLGIKGCQSVWLAGDLHGRKGDSF